MENKSAIHFLMTGGTIDSYFDPIEGTTIPTEHSYIPKFIPLLKLYENCIFTEVCMKDSRDLLEDDRKRLLKAIKESDSQRVIITHGSYTVSDTARFIQENFREKNKTIIFVCAMVPLDGFSPTDAGFNLGYAVAKSQDLEPGIYVCMNGRVFDAEEVTKILSEGRFGSIYTK
ncbi:MAG: asparaginase domain-containing protein [Patescibacteria group bacterium]